MNQRIADSACRPADKRDDIERVVPGFVSAAPQRDDDLAPSWNGSQLWQRLEFEAADKIEQRLMFGLNAGQFHALVAEPAQKQRAGRIETGQFAKIERASRM